jgi:hypothetical protein
MLEQHGLSPLVEIAPPYEGIFVLEEDISYSVVNIENVGMERSHGSLEG